MNVDRCSLKLRVFTLVLNTADFINERATPTLGMSHALLGPTALFSTYIFLGLFIVGGLRQQYASWFLQIYALLLCTSVQISSSFIVFRNLKTVDSSKRNAATVLNGLLPLIIALMLLGDLVVLIFSIRPAISPPSVVTNSRVNSQSDIQQTGIQNE